MDSTDSEGEFLTSSGRIMMDPLRSYLMDLQELTDTFVKPRASLTLIFYMIQEKMILVTRIIEEVSNKNRYYEEGSKSAKEAYDTMVAFLEKWEDNVNLCISTANDCAVGCTQIREAMNMIIEAYNLNRHLRRNSLHVCMQIHDAVNDGFKSWIKHLKTEGFNDDFGYACAVDGFCTLRQNSKILSDLLIRFSTDKFDRNGASLYKYMERKYVEIGLAFRRMCEVGCYVLDFLNHFFFTLNRMLETMILINNVVLRNSVITVPLPPPIEVRNRAANPARRRRRRRRRN